MNASWMVESANLWGFHGTVMAESNQAMPRHAVDAYWLSNRTRFDAWNRELTRGKPDLASISFEVRRSGWLAAESVFEEILLAEPLCRVSVAVACRLEERRVDPDSRAILHNVFCSQVDLRRRALRWILQGIDDDQPSAHRLNRIRAYLEHWTDLLLGFFASPESASDYGFSPDRVQEFSEEFHHSALGNASEAAWTLLLAGNRTWMSKYCMQEAPHAALNQRVCQAALGMVHPLWFDSLGLLPCRASQSLTNGLNFLDRTLDQLVQGRWMEDAKIQTDSENRFSV